MFRERLGCTVQIKVVSLSLVNCSDIFKSCQARATRQVPPAGSAIQVEGENPHPSMSIAAGDRHDGGSIAANLLRRPFLPPSLRLALPPEPARRVYRARLRGGMGRARRPAR